MKTAVVFIVLMMVGVAMATEVTVMARANLRMQHQAQSGLRVRSGVNATADPFPWGWDVGALVGQTINNVQNAIMQPWPYRCVASGPWSFPNYPIPARWTKESQSQGCAVYGPDNMLPAHLARTFTCGNAAASGTFTAGSMGTGFVVGLFAPIIQAAQNCINAVLSAVVAAVNTWAATNQMLPLNNAAGIVAWFQSMGSLMNAIKSAIASCTAAVTIVTNVIAKIATIGASSFLTGGLNPVCDAVHWLNNGMDACHSQCTSDPSGGTWCPSTDCGYDVGFFLGTALYAVTLSA